MGKDAYADPLFRKQLPVNPTLEQVAQHVNYMQTATEARFKLIADALTDIKNRLDKLEV